MRSSLEWLAADWDLSGRDESYLLHGARLTKFNEWAVDHSSEVGPLERQFIEAAKPSRQLEQLAADWDLSGRDDAYPARGALLSAFDQWAADHAGDVGPLEREFIEASKGLGFPRA